jgi:hypothetical protein
LLGTTPDSQCRQQPTNQAAIETITETHRGNGFAAVDPHDHGESPRTAPRPVRLQIPGLKKGGDSEAEGRAIPVAGKTEERILRAMEKMRGELRCPTEKSDRHH